MPAGKWEKCEKCEKGQVHGRPHRLLRSALAFSGTLYLPFLSAGCDDPYTIEWYEIPDTATLYSMARPEMNLSSAFDFLYGTAMPVEGVDATGQWDVALDTQDGKLVLSPPGVFGIDSEARISDMGEIDFRELRKAPTDSLLYIHDRSVPLQEGVVYVVRTREITDRYYGYTCVYYAKLEPLVLDVEEGRLQFHYLSNPNCNDILLVPK
jgi:hypothetical protein